MAGSEDKLTYHSTHFDSFSVGDAYKDQIRCDTAPMDACHLLLGHSWIFDRRIQHDGFLNILYVPR